MYIYAAPVTFVVYQKVFEMPPEHIPRTSVSCLGCWWNRTERGPDFGPFGRGLVAALVHILMFGTLQKMQRGWEGVAFLSFWGLLCIEKDYIYNILYIYGIDASGLQGMCVFFSFAQVYISRT